MNAAEILRELVAIPTPSSVSNLPLLRWVEAYLKPLGWRLERMEWVDENGVSKANLIAFAGPVESALSNAPIDLAFLCHTDTVPYATNWKQALTLEARDGALHGCGSCDVKGALASFLAAADGLDARRTQQRVAMILTADEEIGCKGAERMLVSERYGAMQIRSAIVSEPTSLRPGVAGKGYGLARITVRGREAHSAFPAQGVSAISVAARLIPKLEALQTSLAANAALQALFDPAYTTMNIGVIQGGTAKNIVAGECTFLVEWRPIPGEAQDDLPERMERLCREQQEADPGIRIEVERLRADRGFAPGKAGSLQHALRERLSLEPIGISFGSEASRLARIAEEVIVIGPGDMRTAHSERECVPVEELERWTQVLHSLLGAEEL